MRSPPHFVTASMLGLSSLVLAGCFTTTADFQDDAENYIRDDEGLRAALFGDDDTAFTAVTCREPDNQDVGTTFDCAATDSTGGHWTFDVEILDSSKYEVTVADRPTG